MSPPWHASFAAIVWPDGFEPSAAGVLIQSPQGPRRWRCTAGICGPVAWPLCRGRGEQRLSRGSWDLRWGPPRSV